MFIKLAQALVDSGLGGTYDVFSFHPLQLQALLERVWEYARTRSTPVAPIMPDAGIGDRTPDQSLRVSLRDELLRVLQGAYTTKDLGGNVLAQRPTGCWTRSPRPRRPGCGTTSSTPT
jgi:hypothetical protein